MLPRVHYLILYLSVITSLILFVTVWKGGSNIPTRDDFLSTKKTEQPVDAIKNIISCYDESLETSIYYHGEYLVFKNFVKAEKQHKCHESITLSAPADYRFLDNIVPLIKRWEGPISVALYAPGYDFFSSLQSIAFLRKCVSASEQIKKYVTFHLFFEHIHIPHKVSNLN